MRLSEPAVAKWQGPDVRARADALPAFGARSALAKDNIYWFGTRGLIFTSPWVITASTERQPAVVLLTASGRPMELTQGARTTRHGAFAIAPLTRRGLCAVDVGLLSFNIQPLHPGFAAFSRISAPGTQALSRRAFARLNTTLVRAYEGRLPQREAERLFEDVVEIAIAQIETRRGQDARTETLHALLRDRPECSLGEVARLLNVSYTGASHLFARSVGLPLRTYQHWIKCMRATEHFRGEATLTEIAQLAGFTDSAHLSRAWQRRYGLPPSYVRDSSHVRIFD